MFQLPQSMVEKLCDLKGCWWPQIPAQDKDVMADQVLIGEDEVMLRLTKQSGAKMQKGKSRVLPRVLDSDRICIWKSELIHHGSSSDSNQIWATPCAKSPTIRFAKLQKTTASTIQSTNIYTTNKSIHFKWQFIGILQCSHSNLFEHSDCWVVHVLSITSQKITMVVVSLFTKTQTFMSKK